MRVDLPWGFVVRANPCGTVNLGQERNAMQQYDPEAFVQELRNRFRGFKGWRIGTLILDR